MIEHHLSVKSSTNIYALNSVTKNNYSNIPTAKIFQSPTRSCEANLAFIMQQV